jgi:hypothetical protein
MLVAHQLSLHPRPLGRRERATSAAAWRRLKFVTQRPQVGHSLSLKWEPGVYARSGHRTACCSPRCRVLLPLCPKGDGAWREGEQTCWKVESSFDACSWATPNRRIARDLQVSRRPSEITAHRCSGRTWRAVPLPDAATSQAQPKVTRPVIPPHATPPGAVLQCWRLFNVVWRSSYLAPYHPNLTARRRQTPAQAVGFA